MKLLESDLDLAEERATDSTAKLKDAETRVEELERENKGLRKEIERIEGSTNLTQKVKDLEAQSEEAQQRMRTLERQVDQLEADLEQAEDNYEKAKKELETTLAELGDL
ncbi:hypothetical protein GBAR_LOCUS10100 [Geodia barretti]|uniref:Tropomyosin n=1 Tax=Geodia barretti TaxID=519541 RepID=A0AA35WJV9_GEOBA|nr:hypothetical protein GBAR_LOCUS10100 [Geodia barretti]